MAVGWFVWNNMRSDAMGLWVESLPPIIRPEERTEKIEIPGRAGSLVLLQGDDVYKSYLKECIIVCRRDIALVQRIMEWLRGEGTVIFGNEPDKAYHGRIASEVRFEKVSNDLMHAVIPFYVNPFKTRVYPNSDAFSLTATSTVYNPGSVRAFPRITIHADGAGQLMRLAVNGKEFSVDFTNMADTGCVVITDAEMVLNYAENVDLTFKSTGDFPFLVPKANTVEIISGINSLDILPNWRWV